MTDAKISIEFVVSGQPYTDEFPSSERLRAVIQKVLAKTDHTGQKAENWIATHDGKNLDIDKSLEDLGIGKGARVILNPSSGRGGM